MHGYGLIEVLKRQSRDHRSVYKILARLRELGLVEAAATNIAGGRMQVRYRVTEAGAGRIETWIGEPLDPDELGADLLLRLRLAQPHHLPRLLTLAEEQLVACSTELICRNAGAGTGVDSAGCSWEDELELLEENRQLAALQGYRAWLRRACRSLEAQIAAAGT